MKSTKIGTPRKLSQPYYRERCHDVALCVHKMPLKSDFLLKRKAYKIKKKIINHHSLSSVVDNKSWTLGCDSLVPSDPQGGISLNNIAHSLYLKFFQIYINNVTYLSSELYQY